MIIALTRNFAQEDAGMAVIAWSPNLTPDRAEAAGVRAVEKMELFAQSDVVTIHLPLVDGTRGLVGTRELAAMKPTAYLINTSRGPIVDEPALVGALHHGRIAGAGLDVYDTEPLPLDHPLRGLRNTLLLPHIGYVTSDNYRTMYSHVARTSRAGRPAHPDGYSPACPAEPPRPGSGRTDR